MSVWNKTRLYSAAKQIKYIYEVSDFTDRKYDGMTYSALTKYIQKNFTPHVFPDKVVEEYTRGKCRGFFQIMKPLG